MARRGGRVTAETWVLDSDVWCGPGGALRGRGEVFLNGSFAKRPRVAHMFNHG